MGNDLSSYACTVAIGSLTQAMRAQRILGAAAIRSEVVKADSASERRGCAYALSYSCVQDANVRNVLQNAGFRIRT